jgi:hypothetical protein
VRRGLTAVAATALAAALLALAQPGAAQAAQPTNPSGPTPSATGGTPGGIGGADVPGGGAERPDGGNEPTGAIDRVVGDGRITEASGMVASQRHNGLVWIHEDSGRPTRLFGITPDGRADAVLTLRGAQNTDWEGMALTRDPDGRPMLAIGDIGDNDAIRKEVEILLVREPGAVKDARVNVQRELRLRYPTGAADAETLVADPRNQRLYIVTKGLLGGEIYTVPTAAWPGGTDATAESRTWPLTLVARVDMSLVTDGAFLPDGRLVLRNYGSATIFADPSKAEGTLQPLATASLPAQPQGETLAVTADGALLVGSEGARQPLVRVDLPAGQIVGATEPVSTSTGNSAAAADDGGLPFLVILVIAGVVLLLLIFGAVLIALR